MSSTILKEILEAEKEIDAKAENARKKAEKMIRDAEASSKEVIGGKKASLEQRNREKLENLKQSLEENKRKKVQEAKKMASEIESKASKNIKKAVDCIYSKFMNLEK